MSSDLLPLSDVTFEVPPKPSTDIGGKGELKWIALNKLFIDPSYQRDVGAPGKRNIKSVIEGFRWSLFATVVVSPRGGGRYAIIDGQHRALAARMHGRVKELPCLVIKADVAEQARAFAVINGAVTKVHSLAIYRAQLVARDKSAMAIDRVCRAAGVTIVPYPRTDLKAGETMAIGRIEKALARYGQDVVAAALQLVTRTKASDGNAGLLRQEIIIAAAKLLHENPKWRKADKLFDAISSVGMREIHARAMRRMGAGGGQLPKCVADELSCVLTGRLGPGGASQATSKTLVQRQREQDQARQGEVNRAAAAPKAKMRDMPAVAAVPVKGDEAAAIAAAVAAGKVRKFENGATGHTSILLEWLTRECGIKTARIGQGGQKPYLVGKARVTFEVLFQIVNRERAKKGLQPLSQHKAA